MRQRCSNQRLVVPADLRKGPADCTFRGSNDAKSTPTDCSRTSCPGRNWLLVTPVGETHLWHSQSTSAAWHKAHLVGNATVGHPCIPQHCTQLGTAGRNEYRNVFVCRCCQEASASACHAEQSLISREAYAQAQFATYWAFRLASVNRTELMRSSCCEGDTLRVSNLLPILRNILHMATPASKTLAWRAMKSSDLCRAGCTCSRQSSSFLPHLPSWQQSMFILQAQTRKTGRWLLMPWAFHTLVISQPDIRAEPRRALQKGAHGPPGPRQRPRPSARPRLGPST